jgi:alkanesulfonate monooxygenase SsuD/methylene tetrahydromethanopterin reductase-like flavin-dependent oxidoreductase (luciferase family)
VPFLAMRHDLRAPAFGEATHAEIVGASFEQYRWADAHGFDMLSVTEHHGVDDGWNAAPLTTAAVLAATTARAQISVTALVLPLHDPVRVAEQIVQIDHIAPGRLLTVVAAGYRAEEFAMAGVDFARRGRLLEEYVGVLRRAFSGEPFEWRGRTVRVTPRPVTQPHPMLFLGGGTEIAARRAARLGLPLFPQLADPRLAEWYDDEAARAGTAGQGFVLAPAGPTFVWVDDDPERAWAEIGKYLLYEMQSYAAWQVHGVGSANLVIADTVEDLKAAPNVLVATPDEVVAAWQSLPDSGALCLQPLAGGIPPRYAEPMLDRFARTVLPRIRPPA